MKKQFSITKEQAELMLGMDDASLNRYWEEIAKENGIIQSTIKALGKGNFEAETIKTDKK